MRLKDKLSYVELRTVIKAENGEYTYYTTMQ